MEKATKKNHKKLAKRRKALLLLEACIYILVLVFAIFLNAFGGTFIKMLPLLFILGIVGKIFFDRPLATTIFGMVLNALFLNMYVEGAGMANIIENTIYVGVNIISGEIIGEFLFLIKEHKRKFKTISKRAAYIIPTIIFVVTACSFGMHSYVNGNLLSYSIAKHKIEKHLRERYKIEYAKTTDVAYKVGGRGEYVIYKNIAGGEYMFSIREKGYIEDTYAETVLEKYEHATNKNINSLLPEEAKMCLGEEMQITSSYQYKEKKNLPDLTLVFNYTNLDAEKESAEESIAKTVHDIILLLKEDFVKDNLEKVVLEIKIKDMKKQVSYSKELIYSNVFTEKYILNSFAEEIIGKD